MSDAASTLQWQVAVRAIEYPDAIASMQQRIAEIRAGHADELVWLLEHPALYTSGTSARPEDLTDPHRFPIFDAGRGGQWTYHGPGQRVAYVMLDLTRPHGQVRARDVRSFVAGLEAWLIAALARLGIIGELRHGRIGIWVGDAKIAALGVRVTRWVSWHGVSLNVAPELDHFQGIVPCGLRDYGVTSLRALGRDVGRPEVDAALLASWSDVFDR